ncbi:hypothetical protein [Moritella yayanosii]|uniref:Uncharacterized protein n=1 Tax=Moritella yayanosii TaxID=69539 RepID=A0A330LUK2_9GAMM|nr:hypothetical protein [Moritella yayanosii]SQD80423.1 conserved protein of unknown function [Moritella yayanosii]
MRPTIQEVINELMFIAVAKPDLIDITVEYSGVSDSLSVKVMPHGFDYINATTESYKAAMLYSTDIWLSDSGPMQAALDAKSKILELMAMPESIEAAA